jgi:hypothetical protein
VYPGVGVTGVAVSVVAATATPMAVRAVPPKERATVKPAEVPAARVDAWDVGEEAAAVETQAFVATASAEAPRVTMGMTAFRPAGLVNMTQTAGSTGAIK